MEGQLSSFPSYSSASVDGDHSEPQGNLVTAVREGKDTAYGSALAADSPFNIAALMKATKAKLRWIENEEDNFDGGSRPASKVHVDAIEIVNGIPQLVGSDGRRVRKQRVVVVTAAYNHILDGVAIVLNRFVSINASTWLWSSPLNTNFMSIVQDGGIHHEAWP